MIRCGAGIKDRIAKRRHKSGPALSPRQKLRNDLIARRREGGAHILA